MSANYPHTDDIAQILDYFYPDPDPDPDHDHDSAPNRRHFSPFDIDELFADYSATGDGREFDDLYCAPPVPYSTGSFHHMLNPASLDHGRYSPFSWRPYSPIIPEMAPNTRARPQGSRPDRLANGYVDLTSAPDPPPPARKRESPTPGPSAKRQKQADGSASQAKHQSAESDKAQEPDLTRHKTVLQEARKRQHEDAVKAQAKPQETVTTFNSFNCVICMDNPTNLTATACGHLFCHTCLMEALIAGENRTGPTETKRSQCPVCRKTINRNKQTDVIPLLLKKGLATQPRKKAVAPVAASAPKPVKKQPRREPRMSARRKGRYNDDMEWV